MSAAKPCAVPTEAAGTERTFSGGRPGAVAARGPVALLACLGALVSVAPATAWARTRGTKVPAGPGRPAAASVNRTCRQHCRLRWPRKVLHALPRAACRAKCWAAGKVSRLARRLPSTRLQYSTELNIGCPADQTFAVLADFRNAARWDPRVTRARKVGTGPIGRGTRFILTSKVGLLRVDLPYRIETFVKPRRLVLFGKTKLMRYRDVIALKPVRGGTRVRYHASMVVRPAVPGTRWLMEKVFRRVGDDATRRIPDVVRRLASCGSARRLSQRR